MEKFIFCAVRMSASLSKLLEWGWVVDISKTEIESVNVAMVSWKQGQTFMVKVLHVTHILEQQQGKVLTQGKNFHLRYVLKSVKTSIFRYVLKSVKNSIFRYVWKSVKTSIFRYVLKSVKTSICRDVLKSVKRSIFRYVWKSVKTSIFMYVLKSSKTLMHKCNIQSDWVDVEKFLKCKRRQEQVCRRHFF